MKHHPTSIQPAPRARVETLTTAAQVAAITGLPQAAIYRAHTDDMGSPGHFLYPHAALCYTRLGLGCLADGIAKAGHIQASRLLRAEIARQDAVRAAELAPLARRRPRWDLAHEARQEAAA